MSDLLQPCSSGLPTSLEKLRSKLVLLEAQAGLLDEWEAGRQLQGGKLLKARFPSSTADIVSELKTYLEAVVDADRAGDSVLCSITQQHCIDYAVQVINDIEDGCGSSDSKVSRRNCLSASHTTLPAWGHLSLSRTQRDLTRAHSPHDATKQGRHSGFHAISSYRSVARQIGTATAVHSPLLLINTFLDSPHLSPRRHPCPTLYPVPQPTPL